MKQVFIIAAKEFKTAYKDKVFLVITVLFLLLSIISVYIGSSTKNAEIKAYMDIVELLKSQGATSFPLSPKLFPLAILQNIIDYVSITRGSPRGIFRV